MERETAVRARVRGVLPAVERERRRREPRPVGQREAALDRVRELVVDRGGVCAEAPANNEVAPCLIDRTPRDKLSAECAAALPAAVALEGLAKLWEDGKREPNKEDLEALSKTDLKSYTSWVNKRKKRARNVKGQQRDFAVKERKRESARKEMTMAAKKAAADVKANGGDKAAQRKAAGVAAEEAMSKQIKEDKTDTLREFTKADMKEIVNTAVAANYKSEL